ncbi:MAG TPA: TRAP transporter small permease [Firmicutes bacterium]|nr:TRAP transporter small permease [Bacillota bacterium]
MQTSWLGRISDRLEKSTLFVCMVICGAMLLVAWAHIVMRYVFNNALSWSEEFLRFTLVWFALLSASIIHKRRGHIGIVIFREQLPPRAQYIIKRLLTYVEIAGTAVATFIGISLLLRVQGQTTPALRLPFAVPYASIPLSFLFMTFYGIEHAVNEAHGELRQ